MITRCRDAFASLVAIALIVSGADAGIPSPLTSTVPPYVIGSPDGTFITEVIDRDIMSAPNFQGSVWLDFSACARFTLCASVCTDCTIDLVAHTVQRYTDSAGRAVFNLRVGAGECPDAQHVRVFADGILLATSAFASLDQDGDLSVTPADVARVSALLGSHDSRADFDGDGSVTTGDVAIAQAHVGASCAQPTPARSGTWGALKGAYR